MKKILLFFAVLSLGSCFSRTSKQKWLTEPDSIKYSKARELEVWGHRLYGRDPDIYYGTPLYKAAQAISSGETEKALRLIKGLTKEQLQQRVGKFKTPLNLYALYYENFRVIKALTEAGVDPNQADYEGKTAFWESCSVDYEPEYMQYFLAKGGDPNYNEAPNGNPDLNPIMEACKFPRYSLEKVKLLVKAGADPLAVYKDDPNSFWTNVCPLWQATISENIEVIDYLIFEKGVDPNIFTTYTERLDGIFKSTLVDAVKEMPFAPGTKGDEKRALQARLLKYLEKIGVKSGGYVKGKVKHYKKRETRAAYEKRKLEYKKKRRSSNGKLK